jgi:hypothetical protein
MSANWKSYEEEAAAFFRRLGLTATVNARVHGARGSHDVDVLVDGELHGLPFKWIVECKAWKSNVPKEKVMALYAITQDVGADRGYLLSERGFQSGALRVAEGTNISLTSIADLQVVTQPHLQDATLGGLLWRARKQTDRLRTIQRQKYDDDYHPPTTDPLTKLMILDMAIADANRGGYPVVFWAADGSEFRANSLEELAGGAAKVIEFAEQWVAPDEV